MRLLPVLATLAALAAPAAMAEESTKLPVCGYPAGCTER